MLPAHDIPTFLSQLRAEKDLVEITVPVDPHLEAAEIHRRVIAAGGPALLFRSIKGSPYPLATNLFGTRRRVDLAFGSKPREFIEKVAKAPEDLIPPTFGRLWQNRGFVRDLLGIGLKKVRSAPGSYRLIPPKLTELPLLTTWPDDGGPFFTLPLVYTEHPEKNIPNLGMYRLHRYDDSHTGFHAQIGKGAGFHLAEAESKGRSLPAVVNIGGPPAAILAAIAPLPENVPELLLASLVLQRRLKTGRIEEHSLPFLADAEFVLFGEVIAHERRPEGPFGDHYGYYSLQHDYPVFHCSRVLQKREPICVATVVGKPRQEDFYIGDYLQEMLSPLFPIVMPTVRDLWSYGETGYHSLAAAVVRERYKREAFVSAFRILGEGQLSLTKFLLVVDRPICLQDFRGVLEYVLERFDPRTDLYVFSNISMDTLDYTGPEVNKGSKGVILGVGEAIRTLSAEFEGELPQGLTEAYPFCRGCLVVGGNSFANEPELANEIAKAPQLSGWPLVILVDQPKKVASSVEKFLWSVFTRFEPGADITANRKEILRNHIGYHPPVVIDARMKPSYPAEVTSDPRTIKLVKDRWPEYFPDRDIEWGESEWSS